jgi:hypothetical protein
MRPVRRAKASAIAGPRRDLLDDRRVDVAAGRTGHVESARSEMNGETVGAYMRAAVDHQAIADSGADADVGECPPPLAGTEAGFRPRGRANVGLDRRRRQHGQAFAHEQIGPVEIVGTADVLLVVHQLRNAKTDADYRALGGRDQPLGQVHSIRQHDSAAAGRLGRDRFAQNDSTAGGIDDSGGDLRAADIDAEDAWCSRVHLRPLLIRDTASARGRQAWCRWS